MTEGHRFSLTIHFHAVVVVTDFVILILFVSQIYLQRLMKIDVNRQTPDKRVIDVNRFYNSMLMYISHLTLALRYSKVIFHHLRYLVLCKYNRSEFIM